MRLCVLPGLALLLSGCLFDGAVPAGAAIACRDDSECPSGQVCSTLLGGQCAPAASGDNPAPTATLAVTPAAATIGTRVEVRVQTSEPLGADPIATIDLGPVRRPLLLETGRAGAGDVEFAFVYEPRGDEPEGPRALVVDVVDRLGSAGQGRGSLALDFQAPRLATAPTLRSTTTNSEVGVTIDFVDDDDVADVSVEMARVDGGDVEVLAEDPAAPGTWVRGLDDLSDGPWRVVVRAHDAVGNAMAPAEAGVVVLDRRAPVPVAARVSPTAVRRGDLVRLTLQADEPLAEDADVGHLVQIAPALSAEVIATIGAGTLREVVLRIGDDASDGRYEVTMGPLRDLAGNVTPVVALGSVTVDGAPPTVVDVLVEGAPLNARGVLELTVALDEPVASAPRVQLGPTELRAVDRTDADVPHIWTYRLVGDDVAMEDTFEVIVEATDLLGNRAPALRTGTFVEVDTVAPRVVAASSSAEGDAVQGTNVFLFTVFSEVVTRPPALTWDGPTLEFLPTTTTEGRAFTFAAPVRFDSPDGDVQLLGIDDTADLAGNPAVVEVEPVTIALRPRRCQAGSHFGAPAVDGRALCIDADSCLDGHHFGGEVSTDATVGRVCLPLGECSPTHHDGGDGSCVVIGECARSHHFGGAVVEGVAVCVADDTCSEGFHFGSPPGRGVPVCEPELECSEDHHFGGAVLPHPIGRECLPEPLCSAPHFHNGGDGVCVLFDRCSPGFHDDDGRLPAFDGNVELRDPETGRRLAGIANCIEMDRCAFGSQLGQDPALCVPAGTCTCVPDGECASGNHPGRPLTIRRNQVSPTGALVDRTVATCVSPLTACAVGFHDNDGRPEPAGTNRLVDGGLRTLATGEAECIPMRECSPGFQIGQLLDASAPQDCLDDNTCTCVPLGTCATGFHPGAPVGVGEAATCVPDNVCLAGARNDGHGACIDPAAPCARGFHEGGDGLCLPRGRCADGFFDDGTGACRSANAPCAEGHRNDGTGTCRPASEPCAPGFHDDGAGAFEALPGDCVDDKSGCAFEGLVDGGDGECVVKGTCSPGHVLVDDACQPLLSCPEGTRDGGDGQTCVAPDACAPGFVLAGARCRLQTPTPAPGVFDNACDPETTGRVGDDGLPLRVAVEAEVGERVGVRLECRVGSAEVLHLLPFQVCDGGLTDLAGRPPGPVRLEVRAALNVEDGEVHSRSVLHDFTVHESLDGVACCTSAVSDPDFFEAADAAFGASVIDETFSPLSTVVKPYVFADGGEAKLDVLSLRHRFALSADRRLLLVTRSAVSTHDGTCSGVRVRLGDSSSQTCPTDETWVLPVHNGRAEPVTASLTCTRIDDGCRRFQYRIRGNGRDRVLFDREDCADTRSPYELFNALTRECDAVVVNAAGDAACLEQGVDGVQLVDMVDGAGTDLGLRILNNRGIHRAFSGRNKQGL